MRAALLVLVLLAPAASAAEPGEILLDWFHGEFVVGAPLALAGVNAAERGFVAGQCHRDLRADVLYDPDAIGAAVEGVGSVEQPFTMRLQILHGPAVMAATTATESRHDHRLGVVPPGQHTLRVSLETGVDVSWSVRLRGWMLPGEPACEASVASEQKG